VGVGVGGGLGAGLTRAEGVGVAGDCDAVARGVAGTLARGRLGGARVAAAGSVPSAAGGCVLVTGARRRGVTGAGALASATGSSAVLRLRGGFGGAGSSMRRV